MKPGLDTVLLLLLSTPIPLTYQVWPGDTPYLLFGIYFLALVLYVLTDQQIIRLKTKFEGVFKLGLLWVCIVVAGVLPLVSVIYSRIGAPPEYGVHDIILQTESAMRFVLDGVNPYAADYSETPMAKFNYTEEGKTAVNPALYHFVMPPGYLLTNLFLYVPFMSIFGFYDARILNVLSYLGILILLGWWVKPLGKKLVSMLIVAFPPLMFHYLLEGRSDYPALFWLVLAIFLLEKKRLWLSVVSLVIGMTMKQTIWFAMPFYGYYLIKVAGKRAFKNFKIWLSVILILAIIAGPFILWDGKAIYESTVGFLIGKTAVSYPISGYGWGMILRQFGLIRDIHEYYPFIIWQAGVGILLGYLLFKWLREKVSGGRLLVAYGVWLFGFWYFSRYFNNSHLTFLALVIGLGIILDGDGEA